MTCILHMIKKNKMVEQKRYIFSYFQLMEEVKINKTVRMDPKGISILMYNMGLTN